MASEIKPESVREPIATSSYETSKTDNKSSSSSSETSSYEELDLTAEQPGVMDWLHPLTECKVEKLNTDVPVNVKYRYGTHINNIIPVLWNGDVYMIGSSLTASTQCKLLKYSTSNDSWSEYVIPCDKERHWGDEQVHALTTYRSKLLLIGDGSQVWEFDANDSTFKPSSDITLPQSWKAQVVTAASEGKYLIVIRRAEDKSWTSVNIFDGKTWMIRDGPHFQNKSRLQVIIHNRSVFLAEWSATGIVNICGAFLRSLINDDSQEWQVLRSTLPVLSQSISNVTILSNRLCIASHDGIGGYARLWCYSLECENWLELGNTAGISPDMTKLSCVIGLPDHSVIMMLLQMYEGQPFNYKLKPVAAYNPCDLLTVRAIIKLEMYVNIPVLTKLEPMLNELSQRAMFSLPLTKDDNELFVRCDIKYGNGFSKTVKYIHSWVKQRKKTLHSVVRPSWKNFLTILREMSPALGELANQIETYFDQHSVILAGKDHEGSLLSYLGESQFSSPIVPEPPPLPLHEPLKSGPPKKLSTELKVSQSKTKLRTFEEEAHLYRKRPYYESTETQKSKISFETQDTSPSSGSDSDYRIISVQLGSLYYEKRPYESTEAQKFTTRLETHDTSPLPLYLSMKKGLEPPKEPSTELEVSQSKTKTKLRRFAGNVTPMLKKSASEPDQLYESSLLPLHVPSKSGTVTPMLKKSASEPDLLYESSLLPLHVPSKSGLFKKQSSTSVVSQLGRLKAAHGIGSYRKRPQKSKTSYGVQETSLSHTYPYPYASVPSLHSQDTSSFKPLQQSKSEEILSGKNMGLPGVDVCGVTAITITNSSLEWQWEGHGLKIHVSENTLPPGIEQCHININASLAGHYEFPEDSHLVSAIFWIRCEPPCRFAKPITVEIQHCACSHNTLKLSFVKAKCTQEHLPYEFKLVENGSFNSHSNYGIVKVNSFSAFGITQNESGERNYLANFLYVEERLSLRFHLYFVVTWNTVIHDQVVKNRFKGAKVYTQQFVAIKDKVEFKVSSSPTANWIIKAINSYVVKKKDIDEFAPGQSSCIPYSQFMAKYSGNTNITGNIPALECEVNLVGINEPCTIAIDIVPCQGDPIPIQSTVDEGDTVQIVNQDKPDLKELLRELRPKASSWEDIGIELDVDDGVLQSIKLNNAGDSSSCLRDMLRKWLAKVSPAPSWTAVIDATDNLGYEQLASRLKFKYTA